MVDADFGRYWPETTRSIHKNAAPRHGLLALRILNDRSYRPVYVPNVADIPALLFYLAAVPIQLFGAHPYSSI